MRKVILALVCTLAFGIQPAWAARTQVHEAAESQQYGRKFGGMIGRGALNIATCFVDVLVNIVNETKSGPPVVGTLTGLAKGTGCGLLRLGSGAVDVTTFWVPGFNGFPVSDSYENCFINPASSAAEGLPPGYSQQSPIVETPASAQTSSEISASGVVRPATPAKKTWKK